MTWRRLSPAAFALACFAHMASPAFAADAAPQAVAIAGQVAHGTAWTADDLRKLAPVTVASSFMTDHGTQNATYTGALLWTVIGNAQPVAAPGKNAQLRRTILVTGSDGYAVVLSWGEIDPDYEGKSIILAYDKNGAPLDGIRLIVPGDRHGGRAISDVVKIDVR